MTTLTHSSTDLVDYHRRAGAATRVFLNRIGPEQWALPTNCDMDVRALVNHMVSGHYWADALARGETIEQVGDRFDGDMLGDNPLEAYDRSLALADMAFRRPGALDGRCTLSYGEVPVALYCSHRALDTFIHGWDIARATGQSDLLDPDLVDLTWQMFAPHATELAASGAFGKPVQVSDDADIQTKLLAILGRDNRR